jgi:hypothetical protein
MTPARAIRPDTEVVFDPSTYLDGVPFEALARLRRDSPVVWVDEIPVLGWPAGPYPWSCAGDLRPGVHRPAR